MLIYFIYSYVSDPHNQPDCRYRKNRTVSKLTKFETVNHSGDQTLEMNEIVNLMLLQTNVSYGGRIVIFNNSELPQNQLNTTRSLNFPKYVKLKCAEPTYIELA